VVDLDVAERIPLPGGEIEVARPRDAEALLSEESFEHEEFLPYWAELWSSAVALAHDLSLRSLRGKRTIELGCGLGLPSIAAARSGGRVLATDWSPDAVLATAANAERNDVNVETLVCSWGEPQAIIERGPWDLVIASDVLYERRNATLLLRLLPELVKDHGLVLIADPQRAAAARFLERVESEGWLLKTTGTPRSERVRIHRLRRSASAP
jgi:predicted nicotinamide N-methyase